MKNITVFWFFVIIFFAGNLYPLFGQSPAGNYSFSISPQIGFVLGKAFEYVYQTPDVNTSEFLSLLEYEMKPVFYAGLELDFGKTNKMSGIGFFSSVSFKAGIPADSGIHENRDWMNTQPINNNDLTHFSRHTNRTDQFYMADTSLGVSIGVKSLFYITPFIHGSWMRFSFSGRDGDGKYAISKITGKAERFPQPYHPIEDNPYTPSYKGLIITYKQNWLLLSFGFNIGTKALYPFSFDLSFKISPLTYCAAVDHHIGASVYYDYTRFGLYLEPGLAFSYSVKNIDLCLDFNYRFIGKTRGVTYIENIAPVKNESGASLNLFDTRFLIGIRF